MSLVRRLKDRFKEHYQNGFYLDESTFLKADDADVVMATRREWGGRVIEKPMVILKNVVEMTVDQNGKIVGVEKKPRLGIWADAAQRAIDKSNK